MRVVELQLEEEEGRRGSGSSTMIRPYFHHRSEYKTHRNDKDENIYVHIIYACISIWIGTRYGFKNLCWLMTISIHKKMIINSSLKGQ